MLTPRENTIKFFKGEDYEWTPTSMDQQDFRPAFIPDHVARGFVMQQEPYKGKMGGFDSFGVEWEFEESAGGSMEVAPLFDDLEDWRDYVKTPDLDAMDWEGCAKANADYLNTDKIVRTTIYTGYFERLISFVGFENAAVAMVDDEQEDDVNAIFDVLDDFYIDLIAHLHKYFNVELVEIHDDWGTQKTTMFSVEAHRNLIVPHIRKVADAAHEMGVFIEQHSCGQIADLIPNMIEDHVDTWRGQASVIDKLALVNEYGDKFKFGVEVRPAAPLNDEEAMQYAKDLFAQYHGKDVWVPLARTLAPQQKTAIYNYIREIGKI